MSLLIIGICLISTYFMTVNQRVSGSSPEGGAKLHKATEMSPFLLSISRLGQLHLFYSVFTKFKQFLF